MEICIKNCAINLKKNNLLVVSKMLIYVYIGSVGPSENVYENKKTFQHLNFGVFLLIQSRAENLSVIKN